MRLLALEFYIVLLSSQFHTVFGVCGCLEGTKWLLFCCDSQRSRSKWVLKRERNLTFTAASVPCSGTTPKRHMPRPVSRKLYSSILFFGLL